MPGGKEGIKMFGCGKFSETDMLLYTENSLPAEKRVAIDNHVRECDECLNEILELQQIGSAMDFGTAEPVKNAAFIRFNWIGGAFKNIFQNGSPASFRPAPSHRGDSGKQLSEMEIRFDSIPAKINITPGQDDKFELTIHSKKLRNALLELRRENDPIPVYSRLSGTEDAEIKGVPSGKYQVTFGNETLSLIINQQNTEGNS